MSCSPSYAFRPTDRPSPAQSTAPGYIEHRGRLFAGGTFFRSIEQGQDQNDISLEATVDLATITLDVRVLGVIEETFVVPQVLVPGGPPDFIDSCTGGIDALRLAVNDGITGSIIIEMPDRGFDFFDSGTDPIDNCLSEFVDTSLSGGSGPPTTANQSFLDSIFTGTERTLITIITTESITGFPVTPGSDRRVQQWNGVAWVTYSNLVQGSCPVDG
jgi:hypothetical protein